MRHALFASFLLAACSASSAPGGDADDASTPAPACNPGTRPVAGDRPCVAVGTTSIPDGFAIDVDALGFRATIPATACTGATIAALGSTACEPIDDCNGAFPPAGVSVGVRADGSPFPGRPEIMVVTTIDDAIALAPRGATIAVDAGQFATPSPLTVSVSLVGRCSAQTSLVGPSFGIQVNALVDIQLHSLSLEGSPQLPLLINGGAKVTLDRVYVHASGNSGAEVGNGSTLIAIGSVFEGPATPANAAFPTTGLTAIYDGHITFTSSEARGYELGIVAQSVGSTIAISKSVVHGQVSLQGGTEGLYVLGAFLGSKITVDTSHIESAPGRIAAVGAALLDGSSDPTSPANPPATIAITNSTLLHTTIPRETGSGIDVVEGAFLDLDNVTLNHESYVGLSASESSKITVKNSVLKGAPSVNGARIGLNAIREGSLDVESTIIVGSSQFAVLLDNMATLTMASSLVQGNVETSRDDYTMFMGAAQAVTGSPGTIATITDSAFVGNEGTSLFSEGGTAEVLRTVFATTHASSYGPFTAAILGNGATLEVRNSELSHNDLALGMMGGRALLFDGLVTANPEVMRLDQIAFVQTNDVVSAAIADEMVASQTTFVGNAVLVSPKSLTDE